MKYVCDTIVLRNRFLVRNQNILISQILKTKSYGFEKETFCTLFNIKKYIY